MNVIVTTAQQTSQATTKEAQQLAAKLGVAFVARSGQSIAALRKNNGVDHVIVVAIDGPVAHTEAGEYFFHLSMAELRIKNIINGKHDHMIAAMGLSGGMSVLDCTLGLATDAIVASFVAGETGKVVGLESSPVIALITGYGLQHFTAQSEADITGALRRVRLETAEYSRYLKTLPDNSFDIVYFDPMFRNPIYKSSNLKPVRALADMRSLTTAAIQQACRVASSRVVIKDAADSREFIRLGITTAVGGKYSNIKYGVIDCGPKMGGGGQLWSV